MNIADPIFCQWQPSSYLFFSENIWGNFIYYSHFFPSLAGLIIALIVFFNNPKNKPAQALLFTTVIFTAWSLLDLILWASDRSDIIMFIWSIQIYFDIFIYIGSFYFIYAFFNNRFPGFKYELFFGILLLPLILFTHTSLNLTAFDFTNCWREAFEGPLWNIYTYNAELLIVVLIIVTALRELIRNKRNWTETILVTSGAVFFLVSFSIGNWLGTIESDWEIGQVGLFGMPVFVFILAYTIVRFQLFKLKT